MSKISRREWNKLALGTVATAAAFPVSSLAQAKAATSKFNGVQIGVQSYSFRDRSLDDAIKGMVEVGLSSCELWQGHLEPRNLGRGPEAREALRKWRLTVPLDEFRQTRNKFNQAGIDLYAFNISFRDDYTDEEINRGFEMAKALGVKAITASSNVSTAKRIDQFAKQHKIPVGMHNHANVKDPNEYATPESFARAMEGASKYIAINLDIGHFVAADYDPVEFIRKHHNRIVTLHLKDRKRGGERSGNNFPFGEGDTPIRPVLALLRENKWPIPANIEYEYGDKDDDTVQEVKRCLDYCKQALST